MAAASPRPPGGARPVIGRRALLGTAGAAVLAACTGGRRGAVGATLTPPTAAGAAHTIVVGVIAPLSGPYAAAGQAAMAGVTATTRHIETDLGGAVLGYRAIIITEDAPLTPADGQRAYARLKQSGIDAILWCGAPGLPETLTTIVSDLTPVMAIGSDIQARAATDPMIPDLRSGDAGGFPVFQTTVTAADAFDALAAYAAGDRGFVRTALVWRASDVGSDAAWAKACATHGLTVVASPTFDASAGPPDFGAIASTLRDAAAEFVVVVGGAPDAAALVRSLDAIGARYVDTPTVLAGGFHPMVAGFAAGTGDVTFASLGGTAAAKGTIATTAIGSALGLPHVPVRDWLGRYVAGYGLPRGGEDGPADAISALLLAAAAARSTSAADLVAAIEAGNQVPFATDVALTFSPSRHLSPARADVALLTLESSPETRYDLGREWGTIYPGGDRRPDLLLDPTLDANRGAYPALMAGVLAQGFGISSQASYQRGDPAKMAACRAIH